MKKTFVLLALITCLCLSLSFAASEEASGCVEITFNFTRMPTIASNQFAVWVENQDGNAVRTIFITDFTALRRGYEKREMSLPDWSAAANSSEMTDEQLDAVSGATPATGKLQYLWDFKDDLGNPVPSGAYQLKVEGSLYWESNILYSAQIDLSSPDGAEIAVREIRSEPQNSQNDNMLQNVRFVMNRTNSENHTGDWLGGLSPEDALQYMKAHYDEGLVIVEVNTDYWKLETGFIGAMHIPHDQMAERYYEIPSGVPVILHCGAGVVSVPAYETLMEKRPDIPQLSYIAGRPPVKEFNEWVKSKP